MATKVVEEATAEARFVGGYSSPASAERAGKRDGYCKAVGGFKVAEMSGGDYDYFPAGMPAQAEGEVDRGASYVSDHTWLYARGWKNSYYEQY
ncbi:MAG: hypothetical protein M3R38_04425 [Actinomycetota bacterium]|nr:hypothetical protein [Actinomycetota bacterium]MDP9484322.1 hypothetical protein [Actinomycetota bacterium]